MPGLWLTWGRQWQPLAQCAWHQAPLSAAPHTHGPPDPSPSSQPSFGRPLVALCPSYAVAPSPHAVQEVRPHSAEQSRTSPPFTQWQCWAWCTPGYFGPLGCQGTLLAQIQLAVNQNPQTPFCRAALQPLFPQLAHLSRVNPILSAESGSCFC